jgi:hypothetical protein
MLAACLHEKTRVIQTLTWSSWAFSAIWEVIPDNVIVPICTTFVNPLSYCCIPHCCLIAPTTLVYQTIFLKVLISVVSRICFILEMSALASAPQMQKKKKALFTFDLT